MREYGTHEQPMGTWSDDSTMTLCLLESLATVGLDYTDISTRFLRWVNEGYMTAHDEIFDIGRTTLAAIRRFAEGTPALECGQGGEYDNGNGSLMRILPLAFYTASMEKKERFEIVHKVSSLTHSHERSMVACGIYIQLAYLLLKGCEKEKAYNIMIEECEHFYNEIQKSNFNKVLDGKIQERKEEEIASSGYVIDTLEAVLWCFLTTDSYKDCVLKAVNLGEDTDTVAAVAGGLAGIFYGYDNIPSDWNDSIVKRVEIEKMCEEFANRIK